MSKMVAVCGSPGSGKTMAALKLAQELYYNKKGTALFLSPDMSVPSLAFLFPHCKGSDLFSLGKALDKTDITSDDLMQQLVTVKTMLNFGFLGYKAGENQFTYPRPTEDKAIALFRAIKQIADYVVVDCTSDYDDLISRMAVKESDSGTFRSKKGYYYVVLSYREPQGQRCLKWISTGLPEKGSKRKAEAELTRIRNEFEPPAEGDELSADMLYADYLEQWQEIVLVRL